MTLDVTWGRCPDGSVYVRKRSSTWDRSLPPVVVVGGWPDAQYSSTYLRAEPNQAHDDLVAQGYVIYEVFTGSCWGTNTVSPTGRGGFGRDSVGQMATIAAADGCNVDEGVHLFGGSHGGCVVLNWAWRNPSLVNQVFLVSPAVPLEYAYDNYAVALGWGLSDLRTSMRASHGGSDKPTWLAASADYDPLRNTASLLALGSKIKVFSAVDDEIVSWSQLDTWATTIGATLVSAASGGHLFALDQPEFYSELLTEWFRQ